MSRSSNPTFENRLLTEFSNIPAAFQDEIVAKPGRDVFHRIALGTESENLKPACRAKSHESTWHTADPETVRQAGFTPCQGCYRPVLEYLARDPSSPVKAHVFSAETPSTPKQKSNVADNSDEIFEPVVTASTPSLTTVTEDVLVVSGSKVMHAPTPEGPLCEQQGDYREVERVAVVGHYRPCKDCFSIESDK